MRLRPIRRTLLVITLLLSLLLIADWQRAPADRFTTHASLAAIHVYQGTLSRWYAWAGIQCRFTPSCSHYGEACIREYGAARGGWLAFKRVIRCGPWTPAGTVDPPPVAARAQGA